MREPITPQLDAEEFLRWEARQPELHHGFVVAFAGYTIDRSRIGLNLQNVLDRIFAAPCKSFGPDVKVRVSAAGFFYADAGVVRTKTNPKQHPRPERTISSISAQPIAASRPCSGTVHTALRRIEVDCRDSQGAWSTSIVDSGEISLGDRTISLDEIYERSSLAS